MKQVQVYFSHPITGTDHRMTRLKIEEIARQFCALSDWLEPVLPMDVPTPPHDGPCPKDLGTELDEPGQHSFPCYLKADLKAMLDCDVIVLCPGWSRSRGCQLELNVAVQCGLRVYEYDGLAFRELN